MSGEQIALPVQPSERPQAATPEAPTEQPTTVDSSTATDAAPEPAPVAQPEQRAIAVSGGAQSTRTPLGFVAQNMDELFRQAQFLANSDLIPKALRRKPHDVFVILWTGRSFDIIDPMLAIRSLNVIDGKAEFGAQAMVARCLGSGLCAYFKPIQSECDDSKATYETLRRGHNEPTRFVYTIDKAKRLGLVGRGGNWASQPDTMLRRRCQSSLAREVYPDVVGGLYDHDELRELRDLELEILKTEVRAQRDETERVANLENALISTGDPLKDRLARRAAERAQVNGPAELEVYPCARCQTPVVAARGAICAPCRSDIGQ